MKSEAIELLLNKVKNVYGEKIIPYGDSEDDKFGTSFRITGIQATFSVITQEGVLPNGQYDIQIESYPPGDYIFTKLVTLSEFMELIKRMSGPMDDWPT